MIRHMKSKDMRIFIICKQGSIVADKGFYASTSNFLHLLETNKTIVYKKYIL